MKWTLITSLTLIWKLKTKRQFMLLNMLLHYLRETRQIWNTLPNFKGWSIEHHVFDLWVTVFRYIQGIIKIKNGCNQKHINSIIIVSFCCFCLRSGYKKDRVLFDSIHDSWFMFFINYFLHSTPWTLMSGLDLGPTWVSAFCHSHKCKVSAIRKKLPLTIF